MSILSFLSDKGGSGKTTTTMNVGAALAREGKKVLMIDMDPQANLTQGLGMKAEAEKSSVVDLFNKLLSNEKIGKGESTCQHEEGMCLIPSNNDLYGFEASLYNAMMRETVLHRLIESIKDDYDFILLDSPPQQNLLMLNILAAVDSIIVPVQTQEYSVSNLSEFFKLVGNVRGSGLNPRLTVDGLIPSMFNKQTKDSQAHLAAIHKDYSKEYFVFLNPIPYTVRLQETSSKQKSIFKIEPGSRAAEVIKMIGKEVMRFERERNEKNNLYEQPIRRGKKLPKGRAKNRADNQPARS